MNDRPSQRVFDLLSLTVGLTILLHASHLRWWLTLPLWALLGLRWYGFRHHRPFPRLLKLALLLVLPLLVIGYYGNLFGRLPGSALACGLLVLKLLETERARDVRAAIVFAAFTLMSALLFGQQLWLTVLVVLALLPALATLVTLQAGSTNLALRQSLLTPTWLILASVPFALLAFVLIPRLSSPLWGAPGADTARTGISDTMTPGNIATLLVNDSPAFRVSFDGPVPPRAQRYFRAVTLKYFNGRTWYIARPKPARTMSRPKAQKLLTKGPVLGCQITLMPTRQHLLPALDMPLKPVPGIRFSFSRTLWRSKIVGSLFRYRLNSNPEYRLGTHLSRRETRTYLQLPAGFDPRARALAESWRQAAGQRSWAIVQDALRMYHDDGFRYTLLPPPLGRNSIDDFLFNTRAGFCEHYASSFTFLMRAAGVPARVVGGYQGGFYNRLGRYLLVRQSDAHAWSEVWISGRGWIRVDPTAAVQPQRISLGAGVANAGTDAWYQALWLRDLRNRIDIVNRAWDQAVVGFNALRQKSLLTNFGVDPGNWLSIATALGSSIAVLFGLGLWWSLYETAEGDRLSRAYRKLARRLRRLGFQRNDAEDPAAFLDRVAHQLDPSAARHLQQLSRQYRKLRYASIQAPSSLAIRNWQRDARKFRPGSVVK